MSDSGIQNVPNGLPFPRDKFPNNEVLVFFYSALVNVFLWLYWHPEVGGRRACPNGKLRKTELPLTSQRKPHAAEVITLTWASM